MQSVKKYFPGFSVLQFERFSALWPLYKEWNEKINVISRKDIDFFYERHVLHSLAILKAIDFVPGTRVMDLGTGGGFPGIPLAIACPESHFTLVDSIGKKTMVVRDVAHRLSLNNVHAIKARGEDVPGRFDFVVSRAVKPLPKFMPWVKGKIIPGGKNIRANGVLYLKGGNFEEELRQIRQKHHIIDLSRHFSEPFFETKKIIHLY